MSISPMKKAHVLSHLDYKDDVVSALRKTGNMQITSISEDLNESSSISLVEEDAKSTELAFQKIQHILNFIRPYFVKQSLKEKLLNPRLLIDHRFSEKILETFDINEKYKYFLEIEERMKELDNLTEKKRGLINELTPWQNLEIELDQIHSASHVKVCLAETKTKFSPTLEAEIKKISDLTHVKVINKTKTFTYFLIIYFNDLSNKVFEVCKSEHIRIIDFSGLKGRPFDVIHNLKRELDGLKKEHNRMLHKIKGLSSLRDEIFVLYDHLSNLLEKKVIQKEMAKTNTTLLIEGWIRSCDEKRLRKQFAELSSEIELITRDPLENEEPPIALNNKSIIKPFEFVTTLYGRPVYKEIDPTPFLAPFFILFFALCLTDAGYGITLALIALLGLRFLKFGEGAKRLFKLMLYGGLVTVVMGAVTGGWFGIQVEALPAPMQKIIIIDPLKNPMSMLNIAFIFGIVHIFFGLILKMYKNISGRNFFAALFDQGLWLIFLSALIPLGYMAILGGELTPDLIRICKYTSYGCLIGLVFTQGRKQKNPILKLLMGVLKLYDIVGYFGDVLSYARLLALGLATSAIAVTINSIVKMVLGFPYYTGYLAALLIILGGHIFNLAISALGAFVHSGRLQYLEFFSKFFEGGGHEFKPFKEERKYTVIK